MIVTLEDTRHSWIRRKVLSPVVRLLRRGASPRQLAWSLATGIVLGINPVLGSSTVITLAVAHVFKLNHPASQVGTHSMYPVQIALFLPFLHAGNVLFGSQPIPLNKAQLTAILHQHPQQLVRALWTWEWHGLVVWAGVAVLLLPALAVLFTRILERAMRQPRHIKSLPASS